MSGNPKFAILEKDGEEFGGPVEYVPEANDILYKFGQDERLDEVVDRIKNSYSSGWQEIATDKTIIVESNSVAVCTKYTTQSGYLEHSGYISRIA